MKEAVSREKEAYKAMYYDSTEDNKWRYGSIKNKAMREKMVKALTELQNCPYGMLRLVRGLKMIEKKWKEEVMESCVSVRKKEVMSGRFVWKGS